MTKLTLLYDFVDWLDWEEVILQRKGTRGTRWGGGAGKAPPRVLENYKIWTSRGYFTLLDKQVSEEKFKNFALN